MNDPAPPTDDERRRAACRAMASAVGLIRFAARYTRCIQDAEDAYQRSMEIALTRAPVTEPRPFTAWLHTVIRNEAISITRAGRREEPGADEDVALTLAERVEQEVGPEAVAEWRERYRALQDGLSGLTESQRICLMLKSAGASYAEIARVTGFSHRKIERSMIEGRAALHAWRLRMASGQQCERLEGAIARVADGEGTRAERRAVARHIRHCHPCRALLRDRRRMTDGLAALVPAALLGVQSVRDGVADPTHLLGFWDRMTGGATVRVGQAWQGALDLPGIVAAKAGVGTVAVVVAGGVGGPLVVDAVRDGGTPAPAAVAARPLSTGLAPAPSAPPASPRTAASPPKPIPRRTAHATGRATVAAPPPTAPRAAARGAAASVRARAAPILGRAVVERLVRAAQRERTSVTPARAPLAATPPPVWTAPRATPAPPAPRHPPEPPPNRSPALEFRP